MKNPIFTFKQFRVRHDQCAMKVNTDSILLGSWANVSGCSRILDMGTGSGLLALMIAQRLHTQPSNYHIDAVEIEPNAYRQAQKNVFESPWQDHIHVIHQDVFQFEPLHPYQFIISNPPYFTAQAEYRNNERQQARQLECHHSWLLKAKSMLTDDGIIALVLPIEVGEKLLQNPILTCQRYCLIQSTPHKKPQRMLLALSHHNNHVTVAEQLMIYDENNQYTKTFRLLTQDFYLDKPLNQ